MTGRPRRSSTRSVSTRGCASWSGSGLRQINGCAYCIDTETREATYFTALEGAALAFTESVTLVAQDHVPIQAYFAVAAEFSAPEIAALVSLIVAVNAWNAITVSTRAWVPGLDD